MLGFGGRIRCFRGTVSATRARPARRLPISFLSFLVWLLFDPSRRTVWGQPQSKLDKKRLKTNGVELGKIASGLWVSLGAPGAISVDAFKDKLFAIGGINEDGTTDEVHVYDLKSQTWSEGPEIPSDSGMLGFGCSATPLDGRFLVSTCDGIYQLSEDQTSWEKIHQLEPGRFFHHMVPVDESSFALWVVLT